MLVKFDPLVDAVSLYFVERRSPGMSKKTHHIGAKDIGDTINLDFDETGKLVSLGH